ncbi:MAG: hypothetical protein M3R59_06340 [Verrucomicrobiota bacterium]|nr:hypothetical protein [Verrucomicrobiota bacterium]
MDSISRRLPLALLILRLTIFFVMLMWTIDKFVRPQHAAQIFEHFYGLAGVKTQVVFGLAIAEIALLIAFVIGLAKRWTYGAVFLLHALSTFSSYHQYLTPFEKVNLLFFAAWPMLGACFALYYLRAADTIGTISSRHPAN